MIRKRLIALFLFILASITFANEPSNNIVNKNLNTNNNNTANDNTLNTNNALSSHRHSIGVNFGSTVFYMLLAPSVVNLLLPSKNSENLKLHGTFGLDLTYTFRIAEKIDLNVDTGFYAMKTYYDNDKTTYNGNVYGLGLSIGGRFYFNNKDRASGFFLMPKIGATLFITHNNEYIKETSSYTNRTTYIYDFYASGEIGFRIDMSRGLGINSGIRPFFDISILDIGCSYNHIIRLVPLPRFAIGILFWLLYCKEMILWDL